MATVVFYYPTSSIGWKISDKLKVDGDLFSRCSCTEGIHKNMHQVVRTTTVSLTNIPNHTPYVTCEVATNSSLPNANPKPNPKTCEVTTN